tara:strand:- start:768 stop:881 length:114 start_codon:yes stop_codon:yes gene_type:complete
MRKGKGGPAKGKGGRNGARMLDNHTTGDDKSKPIDGD